MSKENKIKNPYFVGDIDSGQEDKSLGNPDSVEPTDPTKARGTVTDDYITQAQKKASTNMEAWDKCAFPIDEKDLEGRVCYGGLDLSSTSDLTSFVLVFPPLDEDDKYCILPYFWLP